MIWGCMAASGVDRLTFTDSTLDHMGYVNILDGNLKQSAQDLNLGDGFWFQKENDPKHTVHNLKFQLLYNIKNQQHTPPQSDPIGHLWELLERKTQEHNITLKGMMESVIMTEWNTILSYETRRLVQSMPKRLTEILKH